MFKKNNFIMFTVIALIGCFTVSQASYISYGGDKDYKVTGKKHSYTKHQDHIDLLTVNMDGKQFKEYSNSIYTPSYNWSNIDWSNYYSYDWTKYANYDWNKVVNYDWDKYAVNHDSKKHHGFQKPTHNTGSTSVFEPSMMAMLVAGLFGVAFFKKTLRA